MLRTEKVHVSFAKQLDNLILRTKQGYTILPQKPCCFTCACIAVPNLFNSLSPVMSFTTRTA
jgi:hypothetical protein